MVMFKNLYSHYYNNVERVSALYKINIFTYINSRIFKLKVSNILIYLINGLDNLKIKTLKIFHKNFNFEFFFFKIIGIYLFLIAVLLII